MADEQTTAVAEPTVETTIYYQYTKLGEGVGYYQGVTAEVAEGETPPANSTEWKPPATSATQDAYFDTFGWFLGCKYANVLPKVTTGAQLEIAQKYETQMNALLASYAQLESDTFLRQDLDARAFKLTGEATPFLTSLAATAKTDITTLANSIIANSDEYGSKLGVLLGEYQNDIAALDAASVVITAANIQMIFGQ